MSELKVTECFPEDPIITLERELKETTEEILCYDIKESGRDGLIELLKRKSFILFKLQRY